MQDSNKPLAVFLDDEVLLDNDLLASIGGDDDSGTPETKTNTTDPAPTSTWSLDDQPKPLPKPSAHRADVGDDFFDAWDKTAERQRVAAQEEADRLVKEKATREEQERLAKEAAAKKAATATAQSKPPITNARPVATAESKNPEPAQAAAPTPTKANKQTANTDADDPNAGLDPSDPNYLPFLAGEEYSHSLGPWSWLTSLLSPKPQTKHWGPSEPVSAIDDSFDALLKYVRGYGVTSDAAETAITNLQTCLQRNGDIAEYEIKIRTLIDERFADIHTNLMSLHDKQKLPDNLLAFLQKELAALKKEITPAATGTWIVGGAMGVLAGLLILDFVVRIVIASVNGDVGNALTHFAESFKHIGKLGEPESNTVVEACLKFSKLFCTAVAIGIGYKTGEKKNAAYQECAKTPPKMGKAGFFDTTKAMPLLEELGSALNGGQTNTPGVS